mmetsp:Transcript_31856/g.95350  ORF Transcript_31856/g.95350 Transcript_31856/m.95350 type:complete len:99 (-) Transcript_31856:579-875(-)
MQILYLCKRRRPYLQLALAFLTTQVKGPSAADWNKLAKACKYLDDTQNLVLTLEADFISVLKWFINAAFSVHSDIKSHTGSMLTKGNVAYTGHWHAID